MAFVLAPLPFDDQALLPVISQETLEYHYGKHHLGYLNKLNQLIIGTQWESEESLVNIIKGSEGALFNNVSQHWNHEFYWKSLAAHETDKVVPQRLLQDIEHDFGSWSSFHEKFLEEGGSFFGAGWLWLVYNSATATIELMTTANAQTPLVDPNLFPLMVCDLWEHAYYIDYRNNRAEYLAQMFSIINWRFVDQRLQLATSGQ